MEGDASLQHLNEDGVTGSVFLEGLASGKGKSHDLVATGVKHLEGAGAGEERLHVGLELLAEGIGAVIGAGIGVVCVERGDAFGGSGERCLPTLLTATLLEDAAVPGVSSTGARLAGWVRCRHIQCNTENPSPFPEMSFCGEGLICAGLRPT
ncbi:MAG: hypothetical protein U1U88_001478 [Lawsonella clevelandensis]